MKNKKIITAIIITIIAILIGLGVYVYFFVTDNDSTLTMAEKQWIEENKNEVIDLDVINNYPIFNQNGDGLLFEFLTDIEETTGLYFNEISYTYETTNESDYSFKIVDEIEENQIKVYTDNYVIVSKEKIKYNNINELSNLNLGVLTSDVEEVKLYTNANTVEYETIDELLIAVNSENVEYIVIPKTMYLNEITSNGLYINYNISEIEKYLVFNLGENSKLNTIIKKYYQKWETENYETIFGDNFTKYYFEAYDVSEVEQSNFKNKQYKYGFVSLAAYDKLVDGKLYGINKEILKEFTRISDIEIKYSSEYESYEELFESFNENKIDIYFNNVSLNEYELDVVDTISIYNENIVVLAANTSNYIINSKQSLTEYKVAVVKNTKIAHELIEMGVDVKEYDNIETLLSKVSDELIVVDALTFTSYKNKDLKDYNELYNYNLSDNYTYTIRDINDNEVFIDYFNFYLSFTNELEVINKIDFTTFTAYNKTNGLLYAITLLVLSLIGIIVIKNLKQKDKVKSLNTISKDQKIRYIDMLTSLKNRNYLNDSIEKWDESEIYPQSIVVVDLNNVAYINDNFGHEEGDNLIKEAANILIRNQLENTEIIRSSGNEFLIYLVNYEEKQVISYSKKLVKEFKNLSHGFGAAVGCSFIKDPLKTIDDAINEATIDMRENKEAK